MMPNKKSRTPSVLIGLTFAVGLPAIFACGLLAEQATPTAEPAVIEEVIPVEGLAIVVVDEALLRAQPNPTAEVVGRLAQNEIVSLLGYTPGEDWYLVRPSDGQTENAEAWIFGELILVERFPERTETPTPGPLPPTPVSVNTPTPSATALPSATSESLLKAVALLNANCRSGPGFEYEVLAFLLAGQEAGVLGRNAASNWIWVLLPDGVTRCWVAADTVSIEGDLAAAPILTLEPTPIENQTLTSTQMPPDTITPTATSVSPNTVTPSLTPTQLPANTPISTPTATPGLPNTVTPSPTPTQLPPNTVTPTPTLSETVSPTNTQLSGGTPTPSPPIVFTLTTTPSPTITQLSGNSPTPTLGDITITPLPGTSLAP